MPDALRATRLCSPDRSATSAAPRRPAQVPAGTPPRGCARARPPRFDRASTHPVRAARRGRQQLRRCSLPRCSHLEHALGVTDDGRVRRRRRECRGAVGRRREARCPDPGAGRARSRVRGGPLRRRARECRPGPTRRAHDRGHDRPHRRAHGAVRDPPGHWQHRGADHDPPTRGPEGHRPRRSARRRAPRGPRRACRADARRSGRARRDPVHIGIDGQPQGRDDDADDAAGIHDPLPPDHPRRRQPLRLDPAPVAHHGAGRGTDLRGGGPCRDGVHHHVAAGCHRRRDPGAPRHGPGGGSPGPSAPVLSHSARGGQERQGLRRSAGPCVSPRCCRWAGVASSSRRSTKPSAASCAW